MRYIAGSVLMGALLFLLIAVTGVARPFDTVPVDDASYGYLATLGDAGYLDDYELPVTELSRLEVAVLTQEALTAYGRALIDGATEHPGAEAALVALSLAFEAELNQIGLEFTTPTAINAEGEFDLGHRVAYLETGDGQQVNINLSERDRDIEIDLYGDFELWAVGRSTDVLVSPDVGDSVDESDAEVYWGELGVDVTDGIFSGHFSMLYVEDENELQTYEYYGRYDHPGTGWWAQLGRAELPFACGDYYFATDPVTYTLGSTVADHIGGGYDGDNWGLSGYLFNPEVQVEDEEDHFTDFAVQWDVWSREATDEQFGFAIALGYTSLLAAHGYDITGLANVADRAGALDAYGRLDFAGGKYHLIGNYTGAIDSFDVADLDADADGNGDQPQSMMFEFVYEPETDTLWGLNYQWTDEFTGMAEDRFGALYGKRLSPLAMFKLEYTHGEYGDFTPGITEDDTLVAELNIAF